MRQNVTYRSFIIAVLALVAATPAAPRPKSPPARITLIGELHGTVEIPRLFENLVRVTARQDAPLAVGLEWPVSLQPLLDDAVRDRLSCPQLRDHLFQSALWQRFLTIHDGRSSDAMVHLVCDLVVLAQQSRVRLFVFDTEKAERNETMSHAMVAALQQRKTAEALILVGNYHASTAPRIAARFDWHPMGWWLEQEGLTVRSLDVLYQEGEAWICTPECGIHRVGSRIPKPGAPPSQHVGYDDVITLGPISASPPATAADTGKPPLYLDLPTKDGIPQPDVVAKWMANAPLAFIDQYIGNLRRYGAIAIDVGDRDVLKTDTAKLHEVLDKYGIANSFEVYSGTHTSKVADRFQNHVIPFFSQHLCFSANCR